MIRIAGDSDVCSMTQDSDAMIDELLAWDNALFRKDIGVVPEAMRQRIRDALVEFLDLDTAPNGQEGGGI